jgi:hypothetical protein
MLMTIQQIRDVEYSGDPVQCVKVGNEPNAPSTKGGNLSSPQPGAIVNKQGCRNFTKKQFGPQPGQTAPSFCVSYKKKE